MKLQKENGDGCFFYNNEKYVKSGSIMDTLVGNAPFIVNKSSVDLIETGTASTEVQFFSDPASILSSRLKSKFVTR